MASECFQRETAWDEEAWWQMYGRNNYSTQLQMLWDDEASRQMYGLNNYPTQPQIPSDDEASRQMYGLNNYSTQLQIPSDDEASRQLHGLNSCLTQAQITCDEEASRQMPQVQPISALPTARPQRIQQPARGRKLSPLTPKQPLPKRGRRGKPKPLRHLTDKERQEIWQIHKVNPSAMIKETGDIFGVTGTTISKTLNDMRNGKQPRRTLTDEERQKICQIHEDNPSAMQIETGKIFGYNRSTISKVLKYKEKYLQHGGASHPSAKNVERKHPNTGRTLESWALRDETLGIQITGSEIEERSRTFASVDNDKSFLQSSEFEESKQRRRVDGLPSPSSSKIMNKGEVGVDIYKAAPLSGLRRGFLNGVLPPTQYEARDAVEALLLFSREETGQMFGPYSYPPQPQTSWDDEASQQLYRPYGYPPQPQTSWDAEASGEMPQVQPILALPIAHPQRTQLPQLSPKVQPMLAQPQRSPQFQLSRRKVFTVDDREKACQYHKDFPSATHAEIAEEFGFDRSTISRMLKKNLQHGGRSHPLAKHAKPYSIGRALKRRRGVDSLPSPASSKIMSGEGAMTNFHSAAPLLPPTQNEAGDALKTLLLFSRQESHIWVKPSRVPAMVNDTAYTTKTSDELLSSGPGEP
ncbi:hypothetical protein V500_01154 [Pseudogymnoascus sp. VKM F-4518 (FW-2643)]|nr:hypothetical protein V500_01154 [Pseudogymnoascus sp. VKM F-4518 (FW-2643)]